MGVARAGSLRSRLAALLQGAVRVEWRAPARARSSLWHSRGIDYAYRMKWHARSLRTGRYSERGRIYLVTTVTAGRAPLFADFRVARAVVHELQRSDETGLCRTLAYVLMPDHLHWLVELVEGDLSRVAGRFKSSAAAAVNREVGTPKVRRWQRGFHDRAVRQEDDLVDLARYVVANPLRAGLVKRIAEYPHWDAVWL